MLSLNDADSFLKAPVRVSPWAIASFKAPCLFSSFCLFNSLNALMFSIRIKAVAAFLLLKMSTASDVLR